MSGNNGNEWNKFLNGGTSYYNFSYRNGQDVSHIPTTPVTPVMPIAVGAKNVTMRNKNVRVKKDVLPAFKSKSVKSQSLKGGSRRRRTYRKRV